MIIGLELMERITFVNMLSIFILWALDIEEKNKQKLCQRLSRTYSEFLLDKESTGSDSKRKTSIHKVQIIIFLPSFVVIDEDKDA